MKKVFGLIFLFWLFAFVSIGRNQVNAQTNGSLQPPSTFVEIYRNATTASVPSKYLVTRLYGGALFEIEGTFSGTTVFESSNRPSDPDSWTPILARSSASSTPVTSTTGTGKFYIASAGIEAVRARVSVLDSGSITITGRQVPAMARAVLDSAGGGGGVSGVSTFNSRDGDVVPASNDYSFSQISGVNSVAKGGSGVNTITGIIKGSGTSPFSAATGSDVKTLVGFPTTSTDNLLVRFDGATGNIQGSAIIVSDAGNISGVGTINLNTIPAGAGDSFVMNTASATISNKSIDADANTITNIRNANLSGSAGITSANLSSLISAGSCTNCNITYDAAGRITVAANGSAGGSSLPVADTQTVVSGSSDATKLLRFEVDGFTTGTTRVLTPPNADGTIAVLGLAQTWTALQTVQISDSVDSATTDLLTLFHRNASGVPAAGYGTRILLRGSDDSNGTDDMAGIASIWSDAASGAERSDVIFQLRTAGASLAEKYRFSGLGNITIAGTPTITASTTNAGINLTTNGTGEVRIVNGATGQKLKVFNTYTSDSNYNAILLDAGSNYGAIMLTGAGGSAISSSVFYISNGNSSGSIQFQTSGSSNWQFNESGHFLANGSDNTYDIGASATSRPRNVYVASDVIARSVRGTAVAFASLPASPVEGMLVGVTDSNTATWGATIAGSGSNHVLAYFNGTVWTVAGK